MLPGLELMGCPVAVPAAVMQHVVKVESSFNPYAIGVVRGRLQRQPKSLAEAVATAEMLESKGFNFSLGLAQVNRYNLKKYGIASYTEAFDACTNLHAGSRILRECNERAGGHWGKSFSCYYSGNFTTGYREGYVQKIERSMVAAAPAANDGIAIPVIGDAPVAKKKRSDAPNRSTAAPSASDDNGGENTLVARRGGQPAKPLPQAAAPAQPKPAEAAPADSAFVF